jgi:hypothetical protein
MTLAYGTQHISHTRHLLFVLFRSVFCDKTVYLQTGFLPDSLITFYSDAIYVGAMDAKDSLLSNQTTLQMQPPRTLRVSSGGHLYVSRQQLSLSESFQGLYTWNGTCLVETLSPGVLMPDSVEAKHRKLLHNLDISHAVFDFNPPYPFSLVARISILKADGSCRGFATGALIAPNLVITAAHVCLQDASGGPNLEAEPAAHLDNTAAETPVYEGGRLRGRTYDIHPGYPQECLDTGKDSCFKHDICLLTLSDHYHWPEGTPASDRLYFGVGAQCEVSVHSWMSAGYPTKRPYIHGRTPTTMPSHADQFHACDLLAAQHFVKINSGYCQATSVCPEDASIWPKPVYFDNPENCPYYGQQSGSPMWMQNGRQRYIECVFVGSSEHIDSEDSVLSYGHYGACASLSGSNLGWLLQQAPNVALSPLPWNSACRRASADLQVFTTPSVRSAFLGTVKSGRTFLWMHPPTQFEGLKRNPVPPYSFGLRKTCWLYAFATTMEDSGGHLTAGQGMIKAGTVDANDVCGGATGTYNVVYC